MIRVHVCDQDTGHVSEVESALGGSAHERGPRLVGVQAGVDKDATVVIRNQVAECVSDREAAGGHRNSPHVGSDLLDGGKSAGRPGVPLSTTCANHDSPPRCLALPEAKPKWSTSHKVQTSKSSVGSAYGWVKAVSEYGFRHDPCRLMPWIYGCFGTLLR